MHDNAAVVCRILCKSARISVDGVLWNVVGNAIVGSLNHLVLVVRARIVACQSMTVAEYIVAALCLVSQLKLALLVDKCKCIVGVESSGRILATYNGTSTNLVKVFLGLGIVASLARASARLR